jgi:hypothetical protein
VKEVPVTTKEIVEVAVEMRTVEQEMREVKIMCEVPLVTEKLVHVPSPEVVKHIEKAVPVVTEVPRLYSGFGQVVRCQQTKVLL